MKKTTTICFIAAMVFLTAAIATPVFAELGEAATTDLLCSGDWVFQGKGWSDTFTFNRDHTVIQHKSASKENLTWSIVDNEIVIKHAKYDDIISLPLDPESTAAHSTRGKGYTFTVSRVDAKSQGGNPRGSGPGTGAFGSANPSQGAAPQQPASAPISPELQQKAADLIKTYHNSLVFVTGKDAQGSGFIASLGGSNFLITNAHVAAGITDAAFKTLDDTAVKTGTPSVAIGRDLFCMAMPAGGAPLQIMDHVEQNAAIGDDVVVLGNAEGQGVINTITGKIVGIGPDRVEIDAPFVPGNSGSPIIHLKSGKVIGVATYAYVKNYDSATYQKTAKLVIRRFGFRIDNVKAWQAVSWRAFYAQAAEMDKIETLTDDLSSFCDDFNNHNGRINPGDYSNPAIKRCIDQWSQAREGKQSAADRDRANADLFTSLKVASQSDVIAARQHITYDYFKSELADQQEYRDSLSKAFDEAAKSNSD